jgi:hypothetical protein
MAAAPDRISALMSSQMGGSGAPTGAATDAETNPGPMTSPMSTPEPKMGSKEGALVNLSMALDLIEQSLPALGSESPEGQKAMAALRALSGLLGPRKSRSAELQPAEIMQLLGSLPQAGNVTPEVSAILGPRPGSPAQAGPGGSMAPPVPPPPPPGAGGPTPGGIPGSPIPGM